MTGSHTSQLSTRQLPLAQSRASSADRLQIEINREVSGYTHFATEAAKQAVPEAVQGVPRDGNTLSPTEQSLNDRCEQQSQQLRELGEQRKRRLAQDLEQQQQRLADGSIAKRVIHDVAVRKQAALKRTRESLPDTKLSRHHRRMLHRYQNVQGVVAHLKEKLRQFLDGKGVADNHFHHLKLERYANKPPIKGILDRAWLFWSLVVILVWVEVLANFSSFQSLGLGDNNLAAFSLAAFFAAFLSISAKGLGFALRAGNRSQSWLYGGLCLLLCFMISGSRLSMEADAITKSIYLLVNFLITGATVLVAWYYAKHHDFFKAKRQRDRYSHRIARLQYQIEQLTDAVEVEATTIEESMEREQQQQIDERTRELEDSIHEAKSRLDQIDGMVSDGQRKLAEQRDIATQKYRQTNNAVRQENGYPAILSWVQGSGSLGRVAILLLGLSLGLVSCSEAEAPPPAHIEVLYDVTSGEHVADVEKMGAFILNQLEEELQADNRSGVTVVLSAIDETSTTSIQTVRLPASEDFLSRNQKEYEQAPKIFEQQLASALQRLTQPGEGKRKSAIHRNLVNRARSLVNQPGRKLILCWSDLILNEPPVSFYDYQHEPWEIGEDRDALLAQLTRKYDLPDMTGVTIINTYQPDLAEDDIHEEAKAFFHHYWNEVKGAKVIFQTNLALPEASDKLVESWASPS
jgi:hypothetical protein